MFGQLGQTGAKPGGFSFEGAANPTTTGLSGFQGFGQTTATVTPQPTGAAFGAAPAGSTTSTNVGLTLGPTAVPTAAASAFKFGTPGATTTGLQMGMAAPAATTAAKTSFAFGPTVSTPAASGFAFGGQTASIGTGATPGGITLGGLSAGTTPSLGATTGLTLGASNPSTPGTSGLGGFVLGGTSSTAKTTPATGLILGTATATPAVPSFSTMPQTEGLKLGGTTTVLTGSSPSFVLGTPTVGSTLTTQGLGLGSLKIPTAGAAGTASSASVSALNSGFKPVASTTAPIHVGIGLTTLSSSTATPAATGLGFGSAVTTKAAISTTVTTSTAGVPTTSSMAPQLTYKQLEEQINKWALELEDYERTFLDQAAQVNTWDRLLMENGEKITELNAGVESVKAEQKRLDEELNFITAQQRELEDLLKPLEEELKKSCVGPGQLQHADKEREFTYGLSKDIDGQLKQMVQDLKSIIDHLNAASSTQQENGDPIVQVTKILNAHMNSLQWIDQNAALLQRKVDEVASLSEIRRKEQERNFRLAFD